MKSIKNFVTAITFSLLSFSAFSQSISATGSTLDNTEAQIATQAEAQGMSYKITSAQYKNKVHMTAELKK